MISHITSYSEIIAVTIDTVVAYSITANHKHRLHAGKLGYCSCISWCLPHADVHVARPIMVQQQWCHRDHSYLTDFPGSFLPQRPQSVQNSAARLIYGLRRSEHITDALLSLHWLRVRERVVYKVAVLMYKALNGLAPPYLSSAFTHVADVPSRRRLRSASTDQLPVPSCWRSTIGRRAFVPDRWRTYLERSSYAPSLAVFGWRLKTELFRRCYNVS